MTKLWNDIRRWIRPQTQEDRWRTIDINIRIAVVSIVLSLAFLLLAVVLKLARHV